MKWLTILTLLAALSGGLCPISSQPIAKADLVLTNGKIVTVDPKKPSAEAVAVQGDRILTVGAMDEIKKHIGDGTKVVDLKGQMVVPGFIEGHGHLVGLGESLMNLDLRSARSWDDVVTIVEHAAQGRPPGKWIVGRGWHQEKWSRKPTPNVEGYPTHVALSRASPKNPVLLSHASGHMSIANAEAMRLAGVDSATKSPSGGEILRDKEGNPTGVFRETAQGLIQRVRAQSERAMSAEERELQIMTAIQLATTECLSKGITSFQDAGSSFTTIGKFRQLADAGKLKLRLWVMAQEDNGALDRELSRIRVVGHGNNFLTVRAIKRAIDGALGPHGAWLLEPYEDMPMSAGLNTSSVDALRETAEIAQRHDCQLCVHAIGDRANRETLNVFEEAFRKNPAKDNRRWRVEHAQHLHPDDIGRFAKLGVIASMQGIHCTSDAPFVIPRLGNRRAELGAYVWRSLIDSGALVSNGTDAPVEDVSPLACFYASVTRKLSTGTTFFAKQAMTREEALRSYTANGAYAAFEEDIKGTITPKKLADMVVLSNDIMTCPEEDILKTRVVYTIVGGRLHGPK